METLVIDHVERPTPVSLTIIATYLGTKGQHLMQEFVPNTYPAGAVNPCASCPTGFVFLTSNGHSRRNAGQVQLRRRRLPFRWPESGARPPET